MQTLTGAAMQSLINADMRPIYPYAEQAKTYAAVTRRWVLGSFRDYVQRYRAAHAMLKSVRWDCEKKATECLHLANLCWHHRPRGHIESPGVWAVRLANIGGDGQQHIINAAWLGERDFLFFDSQYFDYGYEPGEHIRAAGVDAPASILQIWG